MSQNTATVSNTQTARTVAATQRTGFDIKDLVLYAVLLAAGIILNLFVSKPISAITGEMISPEFMISSFCLTILIVRPTAPRAMVLGLIAGAVIQITASVKGPDLVAETVAAGLMALIVKFGMSTGAKPVIPAVGAFLTTTVSGCIYALIVPMLTQVDPGIIFVMLPCVLATGVFNAILVSALYLPIKKALKLND